MGSLDLGSAAFPVVYADVEPVLTRSTVQLLSSL